MASTQNKNLTSTSATDLSELLSQLPYASQEDLELVYSSYDEAVQAATVQDGLSEEQTLFVRSNFRVIDNKDDLLQVPFMIRAIRFAQDQESERPYVVVYAIAKLPAGDEMVIITDGSTGIYAQLVREVQRRLEDKHPTPTQWFNVVNGLSKSEYKLTEVDGKPRPAKPGEKVSGSATTYYLG